MGSSEYSGASKFYRYRHPYLPRFFEDCADDLGLNRSHRLLDLGCGPGAVAGGFSGFVGEVLAIDKSAEMIELALADHPDRAYLRFRCARLEEIDGSGEFDVVTIGRAIHWFDRDRTVTRLEALLARGAHIIVCGSGFADDNSGWLRAYGETRARWSTRTTAPEIDGISFFQGTEFVFQKLIAVRGAQRLTIDDLVNHSLSHSSLYDQVNRSRDSYRAELESALRPFLRDRFIEAEFVTWGNIFEWAD